MDEILEALIRREGGFVDHPQDRGGPTKFGITLETLAAWRGGPVTSNDVAALSAAEAKRIYLARYVTDPGFERLPDPLRELIVDAAVNHGVKRAIELLQRALGVEADGVFGPITKARLEALDPHEAYRRLLAERVRFYGRIVRLNPSQVVFISGWLARMAEFIERG